uniref:Gsp_46 putative toxin n=1 Tax=Gemmula speciosa TaxID=439592 RepID=A0A098LW64_GEMSP
MAFSLGILVCITMVVAMTTIVNAQTGELKQCKRRQVCGILTDKGPNDLCQCPDNEACPFYHIDRSIEMVYYICESIHAIRSCRSENEKVITFRNDLPIVRCRCREYDWPPNAELELYCSELLD